MPAGRRTSGAGRRLGGMVSGFALLAAALLVAAAVVAVIRGSDTSDEVDVRAEASARASEERGRPPAAPSAPPTVGADALVDVAVATLWAEPAVTRPVDGGSLTNPVHVEQWLSAMTTDDRLWLVDRTVTQALYGDRVRVLETRGDWARVVVVGQPSSLHPDGYPGWLPAVQLSRPASADTGRSAVVTTPTAELRDPAEPTIAVMELSYATALPVTGVDDRGVTVARPDGRPGLLSPADVEVAGSAPGRPLGADLVDSARRFSGLPYLWAGTSALGFDCSGFTWGVYRAHGIVIPRDARDQAAAGWPVEPSQLEPGDLLFYGASRDTIHHVAMYVGDGRMIQSPATGRTVETVSVAGSPLAREFWGARRYV